MDTIFDIIEIAAGCLGLAIAAWFIYVIWKERTDLGIWVAVGFTVFVVGAVLKSARFMG